MYLANALIVLAIMALVIPAVLFAAYIMVSPVRPTMMFLLRCVLCAANGPASTTTSAASGTTSLALKMPGPNSAKRSGGSTSTRMKVFPYPRDTSIISAAGISGTLASMAGLPR